MKKLLMIAALTIGLSMPAMAQTITNDNYISVPKQNVQLVQIKKWKNNPFFKGTDVSINFVGKGLYNSDWDKWINLIFLPARGFPADKEIVLMGGSTVSFYYKGLKAGSLKGSPGLNDRLLFNVNYKNDDLFIDDLIEQIGQEFSGYTQSSGKFLFYDVTTYVKK